MRVKSLKLEKFGPFREYELPFATVDKCMLLTGKNNEGKSTIINALKLIDSALRVIGQRKYQITIEGNLYYTLQKQDVGHIQIKRLINNYDDEVATITLLFQNDFEVNCYIDPNEELIYADYNGRIPRDINKIFAFVPVLGPLSETEEILNNKNYIRANFRTSLAPRHLRNTLLQIMTNEEYELIKKIISQSWEEIELEEIDVNYTENNISVFYKENRISREISWSGQGLQVWFQIITHLVRLKDYEILILDEPEINLYPEKQNELLFILSEYFKGNILIATHSVELMNNVNVDHIINVQKKTSRPKIKSTDDRKSLEIIRSEVGSNFNLIASQFERFNCIIFTEDKYDFNLLGKLFIKYSMQYQMFNIPIHGFQEYKKIKAYKNAYELLIGNEINYLCILDRDYYPEEYLGNVKAELFSEGINLIYTPGKEIENLLLNFNNIKKLLREEWKDSFEEFIRNLYIKYKHDCLGNYITLHDKFLRGIDKKTLIHKFGPIYETKWNNDIPELRFCPGKKFIAEIRGFYRNLEKKNLTDENLIDSISDEHESMVLEWLHEIENYL